MVGSKAVTELETLLARFPERMGDTRFASRLAGKGTRITVRHDGLAIDARGVRYKPVNEPQTGYGLTEGVYLLVGTKRARLVVATDNEAYVPIEPFDLALLMTNAPTKLSDLDTELRFLQIMASVRSLLE